MTGEKIQYYRRAAGMSQDELAQRLLVSRQTVSLWETGQTQPTIDNLLRLKELFGVSIDELLCTDDKNIPKSDEPTNAWQNAQLNTAERKGARMHRAPLITLISGVMLCVVLGITLALLANFGVFDAPRRAFKLNFYVESELYKSVETDCVSLQMPEIPQRDGYIFEGWFFDVDVWAEPLRLVSVYELSADSGVASVYAKWSRLSEFDYVINFVSDGKKYATVGCDGVSIKMPDNPTKKESVFEGWYYNDGTPFTLNSLADRPLSQSNEHTLYAYWTSIITYTVIYNPNGGKGSVSSRRCRLDVSFDIPSASYSHPQGYVFDCWNTAEDGTGDSYYPGQTVKNLLTKRGSIILYAVWRQNKSQ